MLSFLFEPASSGCQFVLFFTTFTSCSKRHFTNGCHVVYYTAQLLQFFSDRCQFSWISGKIVSIPTPCLSTVKLERFFNSIPCRTTQFNLRTFMSGNLTPSSGWLERVDFLVHKTLLFWNMFRKIVIEYFICIVLIYLFEIKKELLISQKK